jgi:two-component system invasion response regulator UvrY
MISVVLLDDHALIRRGMRDVLAAGHGIEVAGEAGNQAELAAVLAHTPCDVLVLDINLPGPSGLDILAELSRSPHAPRTLVVSMYPEEQYAIKALQAGAWGYINKSADGALLVQAVLTVAHGGKYVSPVITQQLSQRPVEAPQRQPHDCLSERELQMLVMLAAGHTLPEVASLLDLSPKAVSVYRARLLEKMKFSSAAELSHYAAEHGLIAARA